MSSISLQGTFRAYGGAEVRGKERYSLGEAEVREREREMTGEWMRE